MKLRRSSKNKLKNMNPKLVGTWFLVKNNTKNSTDRMICKADSVHESEDAKGAFVSVGSKTGWMSLDNESDRFWGEDYIDITPADFNALNLPEVTYENSPLEIEIMPSGNVYFY